MNKLMYVTLLLLLCLSCSKDDDPQPKAAMQLASVSCGSTDIQQFQYDSYGRVISYKYISTSDSLVSEYSYVSDNLVKISTKQVTFGYTHSDENIRTYDDELYLENGRVVVCDGIVSMKGPYFMDKKYRQEFNYTKEGYLSSVKWTQWDKIRDEWAEDKPWTWENYYYWEDGNLIKYEDFLGHSYPCVTYSLEYSDITGVRNIVFGYLDLHQYFPLQLNGNFGLQPRSLIKGFGRADTFNGNLSMSYLYDIADGIITNYKSTMSSGRSFDYSVHWTK